MSLVRNHSLSSLLLFRIAVFLLFLLLLVLLLISCLNQKEYFSYLFPTEIKIVVVTFLPLYCVGIKIVLILPLLLMLFLLLLVLLVVVVLPFAFALVGLFLYLLAVVDVLFPHEVLSALVSLPHFPLNVYLFPLLVYLYFYLLLLLSL